MQHWRIAEMEKTYVAHLLGNNVAGRKSIIGPWMMKDDTVQAWRTDDDRVRTLLILHHQHPFGQHITVATYNVQDSTTEQVIAHFAHQARGDAQVVQGQACVGNRPTDGQDGRTNVDQLTRGQHLADARVLPKGWENVQANMTCYDDLRRYARHDGYLLHTRISFLRYSNSLSLFVRLQRCSKKEMAFLRLSRGNTVQRLPHIRAMSQLVAERGPHLQDRIGEAKLKDCSSDAGIGRLVRDIHHMPHLLIARCIGEPG